MRKSKAETLFVSQSSLEGSGDARSGPQECGGQVLPDPLSGGSHRPSRACRTKFRDQALRSIRQIELIDTRFASALLPEKSTSSPKRSRRVSTDTVVPCPVFCSMSLPVSFLFYVRCLSLSLHASDMLALVAYCACCSVDLNRQDLLLQSTEVLSVHVTSTATCSASAPRGHPLVSLRRFGLFRSYASRLSRHVGARKWAWFEAMGLTLLTMKIASGGALAAVFFASTAQAADADPECTPDPFTLAAIVRAATVGIAAWTKQVRRSSCAALVRSRGSLGISSSCCWHYYRGRRCWSGVIGRRT